VEATAADEIGELGRWFNRFVERVHDMVLEIGTVTRDVAAASTQIAASGEEMARGASEQAEQVRQISAAVEQMASSVVEVARKSADAAGTAEQAGEAAEAGGAVVNQTVADMGSIQEAVRSSAASVQDLGARGEQIGQIIAVINDIADQTNLLALNAAIEAARAGEHGRGFAVVADEVRKLADRTTKATDEIAGSITAIQTETLDAVQRMEAGSARVEQGVNKAHEAGASLERIVGAAQSVTSMIQSIAAAAEQQSAASEEVSRNIASIEAVARQTREGTDQAARAAGDLSTKAERLQTLVNGFKVAAP
jgi:methyl-accepting chemotaxis protein